VHKDFGEVREDFLGYYNRELSYLRQLGDDFGRKHPAVASRLRLERDQCDDPHVERLLESFAFLAARIHLRLDDEFPEITAALLEELYPNFTRPVPSSAMVEFQIDPALGKATTARKIPRGTSIHSRPSDGFVCRFRTCQDTELWPLNVDRATWGAASTLPPALVDRPTAAVLDLRLSCMPEVSFNGLGLSRLRFHLNGASDVVYPLYELLLSRCHKVLVRDAETEGTTKTLELTASPGGFGEQEGLSLGSHRRRSFIGYELLEDYFSFPEKFLFIDLAGFEKFSSAGISRQASLLFLISPFERMEWRSVLEQGVSAKTFRLNCTPIVNLFPVVSDPIPVRRNVFEVPIPVKARMEIHSVESVSGQVSSSAERARFERFIDCGKEETGGRVAGYWSAVRRPSRRDENTSEMLLSLMDRGGSCIEPGADSLTARLICTNRDWPFRLPIGDPKGDFQMEEYPEVQKILCLRRPTAGSPAPAAKTSLWRLISQLSLNHLSLIDEGKNALQCLLRVHNFTELDFGEENIEGISEVASHPHFARVSSQHGMAFVRGKRVEISMDEDRFAGSGIFLFGTVIERFLGLYTSLNSFSQLTLKSRQRGEKAVHNWPPRAGMKVVL
jgi:type VI secretion system protein ImpG